MGVWYSLIIQNLANYSYLLKYYLFICFWRFPFGNLFRKLGYVRNASLVLMETYLLSQSV